MPEMPYGDGFFFPRHVPLAAGRLGAPPASGTWSRCAKHLQKQEREGERRVADGSRDGGIKESGELESQISTSRE